MVYDYSYRRKHRSPRDPRSQARAPSARLRGIKAPYVRTSLSPDIVLQRLPKPRRRPARVDSSGRHIDEVIELSSDSDDGDGEASSPTSIIRRPGVDVESTPIATPTPRSSDATPQRQGSGTPRTSGSHAPGRAFSRALGETSALEVYADATSKRINDHTRPPSCRFSLACRHSAPRRGSARAYGRSTRLSNPSSRSAAIHDRRWPWMARGHGRWSVCCAAPSRSSRQDQARPWMRSGGMCARNTSRRAGARRPTNVSPVSGDLDRGLGVVSR
ncbi:hypothetical protein C2E23DRAFT_74061 [Lenzites betulinus]|nr:hypothetical protein C2E23DRAFT_74061 [Lenzites betulinus]